VTDGTEKAKQYLLYAPVGLAYFLRDTAPTFMQMFVARGRSVVAQHEHSIDAELARAKSLGQLTVMFGKPELEKRLNDLRGMGESLVGEQVAQWWPGASSSTADQPATRTTSAPPPRPSAPATPPVARPLTGSTGDTSGLAIDAYDALSASQVIERLSDLSPDEIAAVQQYELTHRNRRTILGRIEQLTRPI
jgi:hypothetical protein